MRQYGARRNEASGVKNHFCSLSQYSTDTNSMDRWENTAELVRIALLLIAQTIGNYVLTFNFTDFRRRRAGEWAYITSVISLTTSLIHTCINTLTLFMCQINLAYLLIGDT